eukprot:Rhum_TRINITY_DN11037_c0_g2::Rhum_TRINITY_DN11037_c0_g2_i1::g.41732::m.41732
MSHTVCPVVRCSPVTTSTRISTASKMEGSMQYATAHGSCSGGELNPNTLSYVSLKKFIRSITTLAKTECPSSVLIEATTSSVTKTVCVTSKGTITTFTGRLNTTTAASGSQTMLNSATGCLLPMPMAPPMSTICRTLSSTSGAVRNRSAMLVRAPVATMSTFFGHDLIASAIFDSVASRHGVVEYRRSFVNSSSSFEPSRPLSPWISGSCFAATTSGSSAPRSTSMLRCGSPQRASTLAAFFVVLSTHTLPETLDTPMSSRRGEFAARMMAAASSWPGSQSSHTGTRSVAILCVLFCKSPPMKYRYCSF